MLNQRTRSVRGATVLVGVWLSLAQAVSAQTTQEGQVSAPDPNAYPMNAAAIEAAKLEIDQPPEGDWKTADEMMLALRDLMQELIIGKPPLEGEDGRRAYRRLADFNGVIAERFPTHQYAPIVLMSRWRYLGEESLLAAHPPQAVDPNLARREIEHFLEAGGKMPEGITGYVQGLRVNSLAVQAKRDWEAAKANTGKDTPVPPPNLEKAIAMAETIAREGYVAQAAAHLCDAGIYLRQQGFAEEADKLERRIIEQFPHPETVTRIEGAQRNRAGVGKPIGLTFTDFRTGKEIDVEKDLAGKVVLIDFWATWCGPCVQDMPAMKALYDRYRGRGFEIVGVSLDRSPEEGGKDALTRYLAEKQVPWPQFYQGSSSGEFSRGWGVSAIPRHFIVGPDGNIHSLHTHRAAESEPIIQKLLDERDAAAE
jgi:thiol-disulfide isomerase/thioredoxin